MSGEQRKAELRPHHWVLGMRQRSRGTSGYSLSSRGRNADQQCMGLLHKMMSPLSRGCVGRSAVRHLQRTSPGDTCTGGMAAWQVKAPMQEPVQLDQQHHHHHQQHLACKCPSQAYSWPPLDVCHQPLIHYVYQGCAEGSVPATLALTIPLPPLAITKPDGCVGCAAATSAWIPPVSGTPSPCITCLLHDCCNVNLGAGGLQGTVCLAGQHQAGRRRDQQSNSAGSDRPDEGALFCHATLQLHSAGSCHPRTPSASSCSIAAGPCAPCLTATVPEQRCCMLPTRWCCTACRECCSPQAAADGTDSSSPVCAAPAGTSRCPSAHPCPGPRSLERPAVLILWQLRRQPQQCQLCRLHQPPHSD